MLHRLYKLPPISLGPLPCGCSPGEVFCVSKNQGMAPVRHPSLTVWTTSVSNTDRSPYFRGSTSIGDSPLPWPLVVHKPSLDLTPRTCLPRTSPRCEDPGSLTPVVTPRFNAGIWARVAALYAQSRPAMLPRRCLTATAGTSLVRASQAGGSSFTPPGGRPCLPHRRKHACSGFRPLTTIPHCCPLGAGLLQTPGGWSTVKPS